MPESSTTQTSAHTHSPLGGKTILVTRAAEQASEFVKLLEQLGASVVLFPTIHIIPPPSWEQCDKAIAKIEEYDSIILTSTNAAENFFSRLQLAGDGLSRLIAEKTVYAVGEKTKNAVERWNIPVAALPSVYDAKHLAISLSRTDVKGKRFLLPKGNLAGNVVTFALQEHGATVDEVIVYETVQPSDAEAEMIRGKLGNKEIDVVTFFSPSSISNFLAMIPEELLVDKIIAVIGQTTASAARNLSLPVHIVAEHATSAYLASSIVRYYE
ncbi:MAG TPA: uroporphyrinogen-III synthase [Bacteroidota bacterium]|nr:uroporphyrinogen-III synthase [Bacteroidota bacterium]